MASSKRERELARMRAERQTARRADAEARRRKQRTTLVTVVSAVVVVAVVVAVVLTVGGGSKSKKDTLASQPTASASTRTAAGSCAYTKKDTAAKKLPGLPPTSGVVTTGTRHAVLQTSRGTVEADLLAGKAPCTVNSFAFLAKNKYFDGTPCHRLTTSGIFVLQCGDPSGTGSKGPGYQFPDENLRAAVYAKGTLAMANAGPGTNGSQFFLVYKNTQLPPNYTPFGTITKGLDVLAAVAKGGSIPAGDGKPKLAVKLTQVTVR